MSNFTTIAAPSQKITVVQFVVADTDGLEQAFEFGKEDALEGKQPEGSLIYEVGGVYWKQYNDGYLVGSLTKLWLQGESDDNGLFSELTTAGENHDPYHHQGVDYCVPSL